MIESPHLQALQKRLAEISDSQFIAIENIIAQFDKPFSFERNSGSDLITDCFLGEFGDTLRIHHCFSREAFTKDKFEHALAKAFNACGIKADLAPRGNPGHDITIAGATVSLKTEAATGIKAGFLHISKFMELGKGEWGDKVEDLEGLRKRFFHHMDGYERILTLRKLPKVGFYLYELVEIPKKLLLEAERGEVKMMSASKQFPKPGTCTVTDSDGHVKFQLYFDGGSERKLQIKQIDKSLCTVHASWQWDDSTQITEATLG
jgi:hypothetical protein